MYVHVVLPVLVMSFGPCIICPLELQNQLNLNCGMYVHGNLECTYMELGFFIKGTHKNFVRRNNHQNQKTSIKYSFCFVQIKLVNLLNLVY